MERIKVSLEETLLHLIFPSTRFMGRAVSQLPRGSSGDRGHTQLFVFLQCLLFANFETFCLSRNEILLVVSHDVEFRA
jgi:hypothetical protein